MASAPQTTMQALHLTRPDPSSPPALSLLTFPIPTVTPGHLLIKVHASAIHPSDLLNAKGAFPSTTFPRIPGRDYSGTIIASPDDPSRVGEEVYGTSGNTQAFTVSGAHAQYILVPSAGVATRPKNITFTQAAVLGVPFTTASLILKKASILESAKGQTVLVLGANGAVGSAVVQLAQARGCTVLKGTRSDKDSDVNTSTDPTLSSLSSQKVDMVVDTVGSPDLTSSALKLLAPSGRLVFITASRSGSTELGIDMLEFYRKGKSLVGVNSLSVGVEEMAGELEGLRGGFESGLLMGPAEGEWNEVPLSDGVEAYKKAGERGGGKWVLVME